MGVKVAAVVVIIEVIVAWGEIEMEGDVGVLTDGCCNLLIVDPSFGWPDFVWFDLQDCRLCPLRSHILYTTRI